jgi:hypothetical protein
MEKVRSEDFFSLPPLTALLCAILHAGITRGVQSLSGWKIGGMAWKTSDSRFIILILQ